jgi:N-acetylglutamate synthase-like GNAT family acetyltransferase
VVRIERITADNPLYVQECILREEVLLRPLGLTMVEFRKLYRGTEERLEHFVAVFDHPLGTRVVGCACLLPHDPTESSGRLMQMAVDPQRQHEGIGRRLVVAVESRAFGELGLFELYCNAQVAATGFYERLGWEADSEIFLEANIPHKRMAIRQPSAEEQLA